MDPEKIAKIIPLIFLLFGLPFLIAGLVMGAIRLSFLSNAVTTQGTVVDITYDRDGYSPVIQYELPDGREIKFGSSVQTSYQAYEIGETVELLYDESNPYKPLLNSFMEKWFMPLIFSFLGGVFTAIGGVFAIKSLNKGKMKKQLLESGTRIEGEVIEIRHNSSIEVNGQSPQQLIAKINVKGVDYNVYSENLWKGTTIQIGDKVELYVDPKNPENYYFPVEGESE